MTVGVHLGWQAASSGLFLRTLTDALGSTLIPEMGKMIPKTFYASFP
jgi:hypothetical protein